MTSEKRALILGHKRAGAGAEDGYFGLNVLNIIIVGFEIDLQVVELESGCIIGGRNKLTCLMATVSPVAFSIPLYTTPKLPPARDGELANKTSQKRV